MSLYFARVLKNDRVAELSKADRMFSLCLALKFVYVLRTVEAA